MEADRVFTDQQTTINLVGPVGFEGELNAGGNSRVHCETSNPISTWENAELKTREIQPFKNIPSKKKAAMDSHLPNIVLRDVTGDIVQNQQLDSVIQNTSMLEVEKLLENEQKITISNQVEENSIQIETNGENQPSIIVQSVDNSLNEQKGVNDVLVAPADQGENAIPKSEGEEEGNSENNDGKKKKQRKARKVSVPKRSPRATGRVAAAATSSLFSFPVNSNPTPTSGLFLNPFSSFGGGVPSAGGAFQVQSFGSPFGFNSFSQGSFYPPQNLQRQEEDPEKKAKREAEDKLFEAFSIVVDEKSSIEGNAVVNDENDESKGESQQKGEENGVKVTFQDEDQVIRLDFYGREYVIDLRNAGVKENPKLLQIVNEITHLIELNKVKQARDAFPELSKLTPFNTLTAVEYYLMKTIHEMAGNRGKWQEEICCICQCDLFDDIDSYSHEKFVEQLNTSSDDDPVNLAQCEAHFFHRSCMKSMLTDSCIKCPVCCKIYGVMIGDQPPGRMDVSLNQWTRCDGYPDNSTITIEMSMFKTQSKNGSYVPPTSRTGYLPNTEEARVVLEMIKIAFQRRLLFTIGRSVTTGQDNRTIWNGVHFKTNTCGGSSNFGYPDPTYLQRVTQELSLKGIYPSLIKSKQENVSIAKSD